MAARILAATLALLAFAACSGGGGGGGGGGGPPCQPTTCAAAGRTCGSLPDGCGVTLECGTCGTDLVCGSSGTCHGKVGSACTTDAECPATDYCVFGMCVRSCGAGGVADCDAATVADPDGVHGGAYGCWALGPGLNSLCWPNGSGAPCGGGQPCPRAGETCNGSGRCEYPRSEFRCHRDGDCEPGEACVLFANLDATNLRTDGVCLWAGSRAPAGDPCAADGDCAGWSCPGGSCRAMCLSDGDCGASAKCQATPVQAALLDEYPREWAGTCEAWSGSRAACAGNAGCAAGEACVQYVDFAAADADVQVKAACQARNLAGAAVGAPCSDPAECQDGACLRNALTGVGYCAGPCVGGQADCAGDTSCRAVTYVGRDPATAADDLVADLCVRTAVGAPCFFDGACTRCTSDAHCLPSQGVTCQSGVCRDPFGRCSTPCLTGCTPGGASNGGCDLGTTCTTLARPGGGTANACLTPEGSCRPADLPATLRYAHQMCGDEGEADLCYYHGWLEGSGHVFMCGEACESSGTCPAIPGAAGSIATSCRPVYQLGFEPAAGGTTVAGAPLSPPDQCAPADAFTPANPGGTPPTVPANVAATAVSASRIDVSWTASTDDVGVTGYHVFRDGAFHRTVTTPSLSDTGLAEPGERHCYRVSAHDAAGWRSAQSTQTAASCAQTAPQDLVSSGSSPYIQGIALDATHVYFMESSAALYGGAKRVPLGGGTVDVLAVGATPADSRCMAIAVYGGEVYFSHLRQGDGNPTINKVAVSGGPAMRLTTPGERHCATSMAVDASGVYWTEEDTYNVYRASIGAADQSPTPLAAGVIRPRGLAIDATDVYFTEVGTTSGAGTVKKVPKGGGAVTTLAASLDAAWGLALDATAVFWTEKVPSGRVASAGLGGSTSSGTTLASVGEPYAIAVDGTNVYFGAGAGIYRIPRAGGTPTLVAQEPYGAFVLALDSAYVYWGSQYHVRRSLK